MLCSLALSLFLFTPFAAPLPQSSTNALSLPPPLCKSSSSPNPIAAQYPQNVTGTINGTILVVPIPLTLARTIIPAQYPILTQSYQSLLPTFPKDQYPMFLEGLLDHDIRSTGGQSLVADFTRISFSFPFVDRLNDGRTTFRTTSTQLLSANPIAVAGSNLYSPGQGLAGTFDPPCEGYAFQAGQTVDGKPVRHQTAWNGLDQLLGKPPSWDVRMVDVASQPYPQTLCVVPLLNFDGWSSRWIARASGETADRRPVWEISRTSPRSAPHPSSATTTSNISIPASRREPSHPYLSRRTSPCAPRSSPPKRRSETSTACASIARSSKTTPSLAPA